MALDAATGLAQFDLTGVREDLSDVVSAILLKDTNLLSRIGISGAATNVTHEWLEEALNANTLLDAETGGLDAAGTNVDLVVTTGQGVRTRVGTLLRDNTKGKTEVLQVTAISTDTLTITRGYNSTSPESHSEGSTWSIFANPRQSGADASSDISTARTRKSNFCQIFERALVIAGDAQAVTKAGVPDELAHQAMQRLMELMRELDESTIKGIISSSAGSDSVYRTMKGLIEFLTASGGNSTTTDEILSPAVLNQMLQDVYDDGGTPNIIACNQAQMRKISGFDADKVRYVPDSRSTGRYVSQFMSDLGVVLDVVVDRWIPSDTVLVLDTSRITVVPMVGRSFGIQELAKTGDAFKRQLLGDYTLECRNATQAHAIHSNLVVS